ncbi:unnamed protein product [Staurois parvus]|uniref:Uncharacterized protein n=1 Tax=Staurois parvus TaxID=386267 RepID=A0ABN9EIY0_9NEOB|nr:unnamed protein product [Staurois parvus]
MFPMSPSTCILSDSCLILTLLELCLHRPWLLLTNLLPTPCILSAR